MCKKGGKSYSISSAFQHDLLIFEHIFPSCFQYLSFFEGPAFSHCMLPSGKYVPSLKESGAFGHLSFSCFVFSHPETRHRTLRWLTQHPWYKRWYNIWQQISQELPLGWALVVCWFCFTNETYTSFLCLDVSLYTIFTGYLKGISSKPTFSNHNVLKKNGLRVFSLVGSLHKVSPKPSTRCTQTPI